MIREADATAGMHTVRILGISGSARRGSYNTALLVEAQGLLPEGASLRICDISDLPLFSQDAERSPPEQVVRFKREVEEADALLFAATEHNLTVTALLKNAIEWGDRPPGQNSWNGKPAAIVSASTSMRGGARAQLNLRQMMVDVNVYPINRPQLMIGNAETAFGPDMRLVDGKTRETLKQVVQALVDWTRRVGGGAPSG